MTTRPDSAEPAVVVRIAGGTTWSNMTSRKCESFIITLYSPPVSRASARHTCISAVKLMMEQRTLSCLSAWIVVKMLPGSHVVRLATTRMTSRLPCFGTWLVEQKIKSKSKNNKNTVDQYASD